MTSTKYYSQENGKWTEKERERVEKCKQLKRTIEKNCKTYRSLHFACESPISFSLAGFTYTSWFPSVFSSRRSYMRSEKSFLHFLYIIDNFQFLLMWWGDITDFATKMRNAFCIDGGPLKCWWIDVRFFFIIAICYIRSEIERNNRLLHLFDKQIRIRFLFLFSLEWQIFFKFADNSSVSPWFTHCLIAFSMQFTSHILSL